VKRSPLNLEGLVCGVTGTLLLAAVAAIALGPGPTSETRDSSDRFQAMVGGLGGGPAAEATTCAQSFDRRLASHCPQVWGPIPGGRRYCPSHALSLAVEVDARVR